jgi:glycine betaine catabolism B
MRLLREKMKTVSLKTQLGIFLSAFALYLSFIDKAVRFLIVLLAATCTAAAVDAAFIFIKQKKLSLTSSSLISGLIIGFVLSSEQRLWLICLASTTAIASKHLVRLHNRHVFNPAALGIFIITVLFGATTQWRGTYLWYILLPAGLYFAYKINKLEIILGYLVASLVLFGIQAATQKIDPFSVFSYLSYFYICVMVIEPKTTPVKFMGRIIFGVMLAALIFILTNAGARFDVDLCGLLVLNAAVPLLNKLNLAKKGG